MIGADILINYLIVFVIVFVINVIPAFMPPTWMVLSLLAVMYNFPILELVVIGAISSTFGRFILARLITPISDRYLPKKQKKSIKYLKNFLRYESGFVPFIITFLYALGPLPSNALFIVVGAAHIDLFWILSGFFVGRIISYGLLISAAKTFVTVEKLFSPLSLILDVIGLIVAFLILFADWERLIKEMIEREKRRRAEEGIKELFK